jgi:hypothetical protein
MGLEVVLHGNEACIVETENDFRVVDASPLVDALFGHILSIAEIDCRGGETNIVS